MAQCDDSARAAYNVQIRTGEEAKKRQFECLPPSERVAELLNQAKPEMERMEQEAASIQYMETFIQQQLVREVGDSSNKPIAVVSGELDRLRAEIERLQSEIRTEARRFTDACPGPTAPIPGLPFTGQADNQVLIAFLTTFGTFLLLSGLLVIMDLVPLSYFQLMTMNERWTIVGTGWVTALVMMYVGFFSFT
uniref:Uncharacterized protein n=1 Tax=viral metagenome TaxID=1070528 RepID=A0A6C0E5X6_9ZZZZ